MQIKYQDDYNLVHRYLTGEIKAGEQLYADVFPMLSKYEPNVLGKLQKPLFYAG